MSWNECEYSVAGGQPITLYEFNRCGAISYFTSADKNLVINGQVWQAQAISDSGLNSGSGGNIEITMPANNPIAMMFRGAPPSMPVKIRIYRMHAGSPESLKTVWVGTVSEAKREAIDRVKLVTTGVASTFTREGLRLTYCRACPYALYDHNCTVSKPLHSIGNISVRAKDGASITVVLPPDVANGYFSGGFVEWDVDGITERRGLKSQNGDNIGVIGGTASIAVGQFVTLYPGCDRTIKTCNEKFNNHLNYGGQPHMPGKSPFEIIKLF